VSRPWNSLVTLCVGPLAVLGTLRSGWPSSTVLARAIEVLEPAADDKTPPAEALALAVDAVLERLAATAPLRGARLAVELADARVHLDLVSGDFSAASDRQLRVVADACVAELMGDAAAGQAIRWQLQPDLTHLLICAVAQPEVDALVELAGRQGLRLVSLQPEFGAQWNRHAHRLQAGCGVFSVTCGGFATVACARGGTVTAISSGSWLEEPPLPGESATAPGGLDARVDRLLASVGEDSANVGSFVLVAPDVSARRLAPRWTVVGRHSEAA